MEGETGGLTLLFLVVRSALNVDGWVVMGWGRESCLGPAEILSLCSWFNSRMEHAERV